MRWTAQQGGWKSYVGCWTYIQGYKAGAGEHGSPTCPCPPLPHMQPHSLGSIACQAVCQVQHGAVAEHLIEAPLGHLHKHVAPQRLSLQKETRN